MKVVKGQGAGFRFVDDPRTGDRPQSLPFENLDTTFEQLFNDLPPNNPVPRESCRVQNLTPGATREFAIEFKAFCRSRKIKTPEQLLRVVMSYCGIDAVLRETAGTFTLLEERISDTAIHRRLKACGPWVKALLSRMMDAAVQPLAEGHLRFLVIDGSTVQSGCDRHRLSDAPWRLTWCVYTWCTSVTMRDAHTGKHLSHYPLQDGDVGGGRSGA